MLDKRHKLLKAQLISSEAKYRATHEKAEKARVKHFASMEAYRRLNAAMADTRNRHTRAQARHRQQQERKRKAMEQNDHLEADIQSRINKLDALKKKAASLERSIMRKQKELSETRGKSASVESEWMNLGDQSALVLGNVPVSYLKH